ncbi:YpiB family protein [Vagococcus xieshaowenii]|uniref:IDEAL domain-containing protein n=1 Tax=Vagococcus xieshaowenii TaxID=2562451 RepID=A0AAJ5EDS3_9ENTE|nr:YpiB family protein [Vagococcus xieshaowenii]QCA28705.1 IDEAL domain-containing protein [Vagococcus xieshaowenii]TFZ40487.1 IDEAL domain-containing protein [Vagococcus xieshaowenii]
MIPTDDKKLFLTWVLQNIRFKDREAYWLLNYIVTHDNVLKKVRIVEHVEKTPRGIKFSDLKQKEPAFQMFKHQLVFEHGEQIFHEIRSNLLFDLFLEFNFEEGWKNEALLSVLEDNPYAPWNEQVAKGERHTVLNELEATFNEQVLREAIDLALEQGDIARFESLSECLNTKTKAKTK